MVLATFPQGPEGGVMTWGCAWMQSGEKLAVFYYLSTELYENRFPQHEVIELTLLCSNQLLTQPPEYFCLSFHPAGRCHFLVPCNVHEILVSIISYRMWTCDPRYHSHRLGGHFLSETNGTRSLQTKKLCCRNPFLHDFYIYIYILCANIRYVCGDEPTRPPCRFPWSLFLPGRDSLMMK